jgi:hypothetical protein
MRDLKTEHFLDAGGYKWKYVDRVDFAQIDIKTSLENPARLYRTVNEETALSYALAMEAGDEFPALLLLTLDKATTPFRYLIATGVHRVSAAGIINRTAFDAYVVTEPDEYRRISLIRRANILEGYGVTVKDRIAQALQMQMDWPDVSLHALAKDWHIKVDHLKAAASHQKTIDRGRRFGYTLDDPRLKIPAKTVSSIGQIHLDKVFDRATHFVIDCAPSSAEVYDLVKEIKQTRDEGAALKLIEHATEIAAKKKLQAKARHGKSRPAPATMFFSDCRRIINQAEAGLDKLHLAAFPDRRTAHSLADQIIELMKRVQSALDAIDRLDEAAE